MKPEHLHAVVVNLNDTFGYAMADAERIEWDVEVAEFYERFGWFGLVALTAVHRSSSPVPRIATNLMYVKAVAWIVEHPDLLEDAFDD